MSELLLDAEQSQLVAASAGPVKVRDCRGEEIGVLTPKSQPDEAPLSITPDEVEELTRRMREDPSGWPTTREVLDRLRMRIVS
jgi:hypothetical protein